MIRLLFHRSPVEALTDPADRRIATRSGLSIDCTTEPSSPLVQEFFAGYDAAFVLPNEKEDLQGFIDCLALNAGEDYRRLATRYGPFREVVAVVRAGPGGEMVAGANFIAFPLREGAVDVLSMNLNYIFVMPGHRRQGYFVRLVGALAELAAAYFTEPPPGSKQAWPALKVFIEQNDPLRMRPEDYALDTAHSGIDQLQRIRLWAALGARIVDFDYVQPGLSAEQEPDTSLVYGVLGAGGDSLSACLLHAHLSRFFGISVLKGADPGENPAAGPQLKMLAERCQAGARIDLLVPAPLPSGVSALNAARTSLRDFIKTPG